MGLRSDIDLSPSLVQNAGPLHGNFTLPDARISSLFSSTAIW